MFLYCNNESYVYTGWLYILLSPCWIHSILTLDFLLGLRDAAIFSPECSLVRAKWFRQQFCATNLSSWSE